MKATARHYAESLSLAHASGSRSAQELIEGLFRVLAKKRSLHLAPQVLASLLQAEQERSGVTEVVIETAHVTEGATQKKILAEAQQMYPGTTVQANFVVQPTLGAGFRIRGKGKELDKSLASTLTKLRNQLTRV